MSGHLEKQQMQRHRDWRNLELILAELEDIKNRHQSMFFKIKVGSAVEQIRKAQARLVELNN